MAGTMMTMTDPQIIVAELCEMLQRYNTEKLQLSADTNLASDLNIDSVEVMDLVMEIEDKYNIDIPINLLTEVERVRDLAKIVTDRMEEK